MFSVTDRLLRLNDWKKCVSPGPNVNGPTWRPTSPPSAGFSILMTSAPRSARNIDPNGPAPYCSIAMMVTPSSGRFAVIAQSPSNPVTLDQALGDNQALHLIGALADHQQRRVAVQPLDHELAAVPVAAEDAHRLGGVLHCRFGREQLRHPGLVVAALAAIQRVRRRLRQQSRRGHPCRHVAQLQRDRLMLADRLAERLALLAI